MSHMALFNGEIPLEEKKRHYRLIRDYAEKTLGSKEIEIEFLANGAEKGVYKVDYSDGIFVASAAAIFPTRRLLEEYNILHELYNNVPSLFPRPISHYSPKETGLGELITMELLPHQDLNKLTNPGRISFYKEVAREIGRGVGKVHSKTGRYSSEPHDGNILGRNIDGKVEIRFCDAIQFKKGSIQDAVHSILSSPYMRPECFRFVKDFREGLVDAIEKEDPERKRDEIHESLDFIRKYNDIF